MRGQHLVLAGVVLLSAVLALSDAGDLPEATGPAGAPVSVCCVVGLTPDALACAGLSAATTTQLLQDGASLSSLGDQIEEARQQLHIHAAEASDLASELLVECSNGELRAQYDAIEADRKLWAQNLVQAEQEFFEAATAEFSSDAKGRLKHIIVNRRRRVPPEFKVLLLEDAKWAALELAVRAETWATESGDPLDSVHAGVLAEVKSNPEVVAASLNLNQNLALIEAVFAQSQGD